MFPKDPWKPIVPLFAAMFQSVMFIHRSFCYSAIAAAGKGSSLLRVFSILQKLLLSQRRDSRLNNRFSSWWQCESSCLDLKACQQLSVTFWNREGEKGGNEGRREGWKSSFLDSGFIKILMLILSTDWQMFMQIFMHNTVSIFASEHHHIQTKCLSLQRQFSLNAHS